ncbi:NAD(P)/FAD-dependent oxidoreductase [Agromyces protaetiae]|nr:NAD(P)/FAD-dependent oxidoreductase [Agromyces protaetiae]
MNEYFTTADGAHHVRPALRTVDVGIVGGGPAGLSAALVLGRARRSTVVIDGGRPRNRRAPHLHGVLGRDGMSPAEFLERGRKEARGYGVQILDGDVIAIEQVEGGFLLRGAYDVLARRVIVATGLVDDLPAIPGLAERWGTDAVMCPYCDGWEVRDRPLGVVATSPMSRNQAQLLRQWTADLTVFGAAEAGIADAELRAFAARGIRVAPPAIEVVGGPGELRVRTSDGEHDVARLFVGARPSPSDALLTGLGCDIHETPMGQVVTTDPTGRTSVDGVWAIGNVADLKSLVPLAVAAGVQSATQINISLLEEEIAQALESTPSGKEAAA